jgi:hypothetical protein
MNEVLAELLNGIDQEESKPKIDLNELLKDDELEKYEEELTEVNNKEESKNYTWSFPLSKIDSSLTLNESDKHSYIYRRVLNPFGETTKYFECFYENKDVPNKWDTANGLLSERYVAVSLDNMIKEITKVVKVTGNPIRKFEPFMSNYFLKTEDSIEAFNDEESKFIFQLITGEKNDIVLNNLRSTNNIFISNSYNGTRSVKLDYVIKTECKSGNDVSSFIDYYTLGAYSKKLPHLRSGFEIISEEIKNVKDYYKTAKTKLISMTNEIDYIISIISNKMAKNSRELFNTYINNLSEEYKNLFYVLIITSIVIDREFSSKEHLNISTQIEKIFKGINWF